MATKVIKEKAEPKPEVSETVKARKIKKVEVLTQTLNSFEDKQISVKVITSRLMERGDAIRRIEADYILYADWYYAAKCKTSADEIDRIIYELIRYLEK
jgi:hypothetical protein